MNETIQQAITNNSTVTTTVGLTGGATHASTSYFELEWLPWGITGVEIVQTMSALLVFGALVVKCYEWKIQKRTSRIKAKEEQLLDLKLKEAKK